MEPHVAKIREQLLLMSGIAERSVALAMRALVERDSSFSETVEAEDDHLDRLEIQIDELVITHMATHGPVATDCRFMLTASKISSNLERVGDEATTIARQACALNLEPQLKPYVDIPIIADTVQDMLRQAIGMFVESNAEAAPEIIARDKTVDAITKEVLDELTDLMAADPKNIRRGVRLIRVTRCLERIGDHAANVAEEVFYLLTAEDIRHDRSLHQAEPASKQEPG